MDLRCGLLAISNLLRSDRVFLEAIKRPLKTLLLKWAQDPPKKCHHQMSHTLEVKDFLHRFARKAELELFLSILNRKKMEPVGEGCPFDLGMKKYKFSYDTKF